MVDATRAFAYYLNHSVNLLTGEKKSWDFKLWIDENRSVLLETSSQEQRVIHLFYELSFLIEKEFHLLNSDQLLVIDLIFTSHYEINEKSAGDFLPIKLKAIELPDRGNYKKAFKEGYKELLKGNCYQFNLTRPYLYSFNKNLGPSDFIFSLWKKVQSRGAFGSATFIPYFNKLLLSNSPECLFQYENGKISSMPIKGTMKREDSKDWKELWKILVNDKKSQAELFMITDLLRNDLSRIELPRARVTKKKFPKLVPGLLHQYSQVEVELSAAVSLWRVIEKLFPGGSITGAPKKKAIELIEKLEKRERGFYCGSTIVLHKNLLSASINIRSAVVDFNEQSLLYQAGGGITLLSDADEEFDEMTYKHNSFIDTLTL